MPASPSSADVSRLRRLRLVLLLYVAAPLAVAIGLGWYAAVSRVEALTERRMQEEIELVARALSLPLSQALDRGSLAQLRESLDAADDIYRVYGAYVYDAQGALVASLGRSPAPDQPVSPAMTTNSTETGEYGELGGRRIYSYFVPLADPGGRINGVLQVTRRRRDIDDHIWRLRAQAATALIGFTAVFVGLVAWGHHRALGRHIERLADDMARVRAGDNDHRARRGGFDEIATLAGSLNAMLDRIDDSRRQLAAEHATKAALEARLHETEKLAALGGLAAGVAHELGSPLSVVQGRAQRLRRRLPPSDPDVASVDEIQAQVHRMEGIVRQLLDFGRGRTAGRHEASVTDVVRAAAASVAEPAAAAGTRLDVILPDRDATLAMDPAGLEGAVANLLRNALQASPGGVVRLTLALPSGRVSIAVEDDGPGVPEAIRSQVCDPFFTTKPVGEGTGLGLALALRVITDLGGRLEVGSSPLGGARFEASLPRPEAAPAGGQRA